MKFVKITESQNGNEILLNINNIIIVDISTQMILVNGVYTNGTGEIYVNRENLEKVIKVISYATN